MLDELEQVKRFLFDLKEAYDIERNEWINAKIDFHTQIELRDKIWNDYNTKLNQILTEVNNFWFKGLEKLTYDPLIFFNSR